MKGEKEENNYFLTFYWWVGGQKYFLIFFGGRMTGSEKFIYKHKTWAVISRLHRLHCKFKYFH
jgi:hypothetical protein